VLLSVRCVERSRVVDERSYPMTRCTMLGRGTTRPAAADLGNGFNEVWPATWVFVRPLVAVRDWTFLLGPGLMAALNALLLGTVMYRSRLVHRIIPTMGLIGAPLLRVGTGATLFGYVAQAGPIAAIAALPWPLSIYMVVRGSGFVHHPEHHHVSRKRRAGSW
jgi:hypothetical protein